MTLTPQLKFLVIATAVLVNLSLLAWTGIKLDVLALGMNEHLFNIGLTVLTILNLGSSSLLVYLGLKSPTVGDKDAEP